MHDITYLCIKQHVAVRYILHLYIIVNIKRLKFYNNLTIYCSLPQDPNET